MIRPTRARALSGVGLAFGAAVVVAATPAPAIGDPDAGRTIYERCLACHALAYNRTGPKHCGLVGRRAGSVPGFEYSDAMKRSRIVWTTQALDRFLANPRATVPGTAMGYAGVTDANERRDLIAYLERAGRTAECRGPAPDHSSSPVRLGLAAGPDAVAGTIGPDRNQIPGNAIFNWPLSREVHHG